MYNSSKFEMAVIYGRRKVGKTSLIKHFIQDKPAIYAQGIETTKTLNLKYLSDAILNFENPNRIGHGISFDDFKDAFEQVENIANQSNRKIVLVLDEFPYFAESAPEISSLLQYVIDHVYNIRAGENSVIYCRDETSFFYILVYF